MKLLEVLEPIKRPSMDQINYRQEMVQATITRNAVIELQKAYNEMASAILDAQTKTEAKAAAKPVKTEKSGA